MIFFTLFESFHADMLYYTWVLIFIYYALALFAANRKAFALCFTNALCELFAI